MQRTVCSVRRVLARLSLSAPAPGTRDSIIYLYLICLPSYTETHMFTSALPGGIVQTLWTRKVNFIHPRTVGDSFDMSFYRTGQVWKAKYSPLVEK